ncbi:MAG TPA: methyltransferase domain-containing protein [Polyangiaceae bacterium]
MWSLGDYQTFAAQLVWELGPVLVQAAGVRPGQRVLDIATGTGNAALRAAEAGASVVASDLTPEHFVAGHEVARDKGLALEWVEADAENLPFAGAAFDIVLSCLGAIFAPRHQRVADEMVRVCKQRGTIAMLNFTPEGLAAAFFEVFAPYMPPPRAGDLPPILWGSEDHVARLFGKRLALRTTRGSYVERARSPQAYVDFFKRTFGPVVAIYQSLADTPQLVAELDRAFLKFAENSNTSAPGEPAEYRYEYLLVIGEKL